MKKKKAQDLSKMNGNKQHDKLWKSDKWENVIDWGATISNFKGYERSH